MAVIKPSFLTTAAFATLLASCAPSPESTVNHLPDYTTQQNIMRFGEWIMDWRTCALYAGNGQLRIETQGHRSNDSLYFKIRFNEKLVNSPFIEVNTLNASIPVTGNRQYYGFEMPATQADLAQLTPDYSFIFVTYTPASTGVVAQQYFQTRNLLEGLNFSQTQCKEAQKIRLN